MSEYYTPKRNVLQRHTSTGDVMVGRRIVDTPFGRQFRNVYTSSPQLSPSHYYERDGGGVRQRERKSIHDNSFPKQRAMKRAQSSNFFIDENNDSSNNILVDSSALIDLQDKYDFMIAKQERQISELRNEVEFALSLNHCRTTAEQDDFQQSLSETAEIDENFKYQNFVRNMRNEYEKVVEMKERQIQGLKNKLIGIQRNGLQNDSQIKCLESKSDMSRTFEATDGNHNIDQSKAISQRRPLTICVPTIPEDETCYNDENHQPSSLNIHLGKSLSGTSSPLGNLRRSIAERNLQLAEAIARTSPSRTPTNLSRPSSNNKFDVNVATSSPVSKVIILKHTYLAFPHRIYSTRRRLCLCRSIIWWTLH